MTPLLGEIWMCLSLAAVLGVLAGWVVWGRRTDRIVASYSRRLGRLRSNWEAVEERLTDALQTNASLQRELDEKRAEVRFLEERLREIERAMLEPDHDLPSRLSGAEEVPEKLSPRSASARESSRAGERPPARTV
jgi:predicted nuclease with TOPRIM domain